jgi:hypothetical protein
VTAAAGGIVRLTRRAGHVLASELLLTGRPITASDARDRFGIVNAVVRMYLPILLGSFRCLPTAREQVFQEALRWASYVCAASPDAVQFTKEAMLLTSIDGMPDQDALMQAVDSPAFGRVQNGANIREGLAAFSEVRLMAVLLNDLIIDDSDVRLNGKIPYPIREARPSFEMHRSVALTTATGDADTEMTVIASAVQVDIIPASQ